MSGFSVANNITLRNYYATYRDFTVKSNRANATTNQLNYADAQALRRAVRKLDDFDFENADKTFRLIFVLLSTPTITQWNPQNPRPIPIPYPRTRI